MAAQSPQALHYNLIGVGNDFGELSGQLLLTAAMDYASWGYPHRGCMLGRLIHVFLGHDDEVEIQFSDSWTAFIQFIQATGGLDRALIERAIRHGFAVVLKSSYPRFDLMTPLRWSRKLGFSRSRSRTRNQTWAPISSTR